MVPRPFVPLILLCLLCADSARAQRVTTDDPSGRYRIAGSKADHRTQARLVIEPQPGGAYRVARQSRCAATGRTHVLRGTGHVRRGLLLVEFPPHEGEPSPPSTHAPSPQRDPAGAGPSPAPAGGAIGALRRISGEPTPRADAQQLEPTPPAPAPASTGGPALVIQASVGQDGVNRAEDVEVIQAALARRGHPREGRFTPGVSDPVLILAIRRYQKEKAGFRWPDGRVDVDNRTIRAMNREGIDPRPAGGSAAVAPPASDDLKAGDPFADPAFHVAMDDADLGPGAELPDPSALFPRLPANAVLAVYLVKDGRLQGAVRDPACGGDERRWTMERGLALDAEPEAEPEPTNDDLRRRIARAANRYRGWAWADPVTREGYAELLFPYDSEANRRSFAESMSSCGLFAMAVLREVGVEHRSLHLPYAAQVGRAIGNVVSIAREQDAWVTPTADSAPRQGDVVIVGHYQDPAYGGQTHCLVVSAVSGDRVTSVDGGQPGIAERRRSLTRRGGQLWLGERRVQGWLDAGRLRVE